MAFNSEGACPTCAGTGVVRTVNEASLVPDDSLTIDEGAVAPWQSLMWSLMKDIAREMGVRTDVPFRDLTPERSSTAESRTSWEVTETTGLYTGAGRHMAGGALRFTSLLL